jgi:hypothetical protein
MSKKSPIYLLALTPRFFDIRDTDEKQTQKFLTTLNRAVPHLHVSTIVLSSEINVWKKELWKGLRIYSLPLIKIGPIKFPNPIETISLAITLSLQHIDYFLTSEDSKGSLFIASILHLFVHASHIHVIFDQKTAKIREWMHHHKMAHQTFRTLIFARLSKGTLVFSPTITTWFAQHHIQTIQMERTEIEQKLSAHTAKEIFSYIQGTATRVTPFPRARLSLKRSAFR